MKKRQKIIVVISCLAVIVSVLAVNCFAWSGGYPQGFGDEKTSLITSISGTWSQDSFNQANQLRDYYHSMFPDDPIEYYSIYDTVAFPINGLSFSGLGSNIVSSTQLKPDLGGDFWTYFNWLETTGGRSADRCKVYIKANNNNPYFFNEAEDQISARFAYWDIKYSPFALDVFLNDNVTLQGYIPGNNDAVAVSSTVYIPYTCVRDDAVYNGSCKVRVISNMSYYPNVEYFHEDTASTKYILTYYDYESDSYEEIERSFVGSAFDTVVDFVDTSISSKYNSFLINEEYCYVGDTSVRVFGNSIGMAVNAFSNYDTFARGETEFTPVEITEEIITEEVHYDVVEPFKWITQAVDGVLDTELFGEITIGHLILCAIAIPCLLAILRAIAGG